MALEEQGNDMKKEISALIVEDSQNDALLLVNAIERDGIHLDWQRVSTSEAMKSALQEGDWDILFVDYALPRFSGLEALKILHAHQPNIPAIMISGTMGEETAVEAMRAGASDYLIKGNYSRLVPAIERELREATMRKEKEQADIALRESEERYRTLAGQLQTAAEIGRDATAAHDVDELLNRAATLIRDRFCFYHVGIFLVDEKGEYAVLAAAPGEPGQQLLASGHKLEIGKVGIVGHVAKTGEPRISLDVTKDSVHYKQPVLPTTLSEISLPMTIDNTVIGVLDVQSQDEDAFDQQDTQVLQTIADQLAVAINKARLLDEVQLRAQAMKSLYETALSTSSQLDFDALLDQLGKQIRQMLNPDVFFIALYDSDRGEIHFPLAMKGEEHILAMKGVDFSLEDSGLSGWVIRHRETLVITNLEEDTLPTQLIRDSKEWPDTRTWVGVPLIVREQVVGVVSIQSFQIDAFDQHDQRFLEALSAQVAIAIENARLFEAEQEAREHAEVVREAAGVIGSTLSLDQVSQVVLEQLERVLAFDSGSVLFVEDNQVITQAGLGYERYLSEEDGFPKITFNPNTNQTFQPIIATGKPLMIPDVKNDPRWVKSRLSEHIGSWLGVPLQIRNQVIGLLSLDRVTVGGFSDEEIEIVQTFAAHASAAIGNARLYETLERRVAELRTLRRVSLHLTASLDIQNVFEAILNGVHALVPAMKTAHLYTYHDGNLSFGSALWNDGKRAAPISTPRPDGLTYNVARSGKMIVVPDMQNHPLFDDVAEEKGWKGSIIGLPLKIGDRVVGVMNISCREPRSFSNAELRALRLLGDQASFVIENANLFEQTKKERSYLSLLYDMGRTLSRSLDPEEIFNQATKLTCQALGGVSSLGLQYDHEKEFLYPVAMYKDGEELSIDPVPTLPLGEGLAGWVAQESQPALISDVNEDERWFPLPETDTGVQSAISAPIINEDKLIGTLSVHHKDKNAFEKNHLDILDAICQQITLAYSNAKRYQEINRLVDRLAKQQYRLESLIKELPIGILLFNEDNCLITANTLGQEYLSHLTTEGVGDQISRLGSYTLPEILEQRTSSLPFEINMEEPSNLKFEAMARVIIGGERPEWVLTIRDITKERAIQEQMQMRDRLATVGQLAAGIAHDFNNIMAAIVIYADLLSVDPTISEDGQQQLATIQQQIQRASSLIRQILDFSRRSVIAKTTLDLLPFIKEIEKLLQRMLPETIHTALKYDQDSYMVYVDPTRIQQVLMNLAVNGRDAMPEGGELTFELKKLHLDKGDEMPQSYLQPGDWIQLSVSDTGIGIKPDHLKHIFEPFFTTKPTGEGTGLGLAQVYGIVKQHEGFINVESQLGEGTTFHIYLPQLVEEEQKEKGEDDVVQVNGASRSVLLVEDNQATQNAVKAMLASLQFNVFGARNGVEALGILEQQSTLVDLVVSDIVMPEMSGVELYKIIHQQYPDLKFCFITGHPIEGEASELLARPEIVWLQKPFSIQEFQHAVQTLLDEH